MGKNAAVGIKIAKQGSKGAPKDGCFRDITPIKRNSKSQYDNPSKAKGLIIPQK